MSPGVDAFRSDPSDVDDVWGFVDLPSGVQMTKLPLQDTRNNVFARLGAGPTEEMLEKRGWRLPTVEETIEHYQLALFILPYTFPTAEMCRAAGVPLSDQVAIERFRVANMMGLSWCTLHDAEVIRRAAAAGFNGSQAVSNCGKHWVKPSTLHPAMPERGLIFGWFELPPTMSQYAPVVIQPPNGQAHQLTYSDYGTTTHAVRTKP
jgi:hypothetical protein